MFAMGRMEEHAIVLALAPPIVPATERECSYDGSWSALQRIGSRKNGSCDSFCDGSCKC